ncbi:copper resistance protein CopC [Microbispora sp. NPDC049125]|uniref:copper resistance CopC family protein n=1 Tax=Microbispora sp. NPDC049125 TaxID=3154929 RepID=UPI00346737C5
MFAWRAPRFAGAALLACLALLLVTSPARAHNVLLGSDPKEGAVLGGTPARVTLTFDQAVRRDFARIAVTGPGGAHYEQGEVGVAGTSVFIAVRPSGPPGAYAVGYRIVSNDGHPVTGTITFTVGPSPATPAASSAVPGGTGASPGAALAVPGPAGGQGGGGQGGGGWVWGLLVATAALLALCARVLVRHDRRAGGAA